MATSCGVHLVGSIPMQDSRAVFSSVCSIVGEQLKRIPDGETGDRSNWIRWQQVVFENTPQLEIQELPPDNYGNVRKLICIKNGVSPDEIEFGPLGYSKVAIESYTVFRELKEKGEIPEQVKFQVCLPTPLAPIQFYVAPGDRATLEPVYEKKLLQELNEIAAAIPHRDLAVQWDTAVEFAVIEEVFPSYLENPMSDIIERLLRLGNAVPAEIDLGYHLCYGDSGHKHFCEPADATKLVEVANGVAQSLNRNLQWIHLPVPRERDDIQYFEPLRDLRLDKGTELYLGIVHLTDGVEGTKNRMETAGKIVAEFGIATECGFGRRPPETIEQLLRIHADSV